VAHRLAAVYAHPDDDTYSLGGSLALGQGNIEYTLIVATSGEAGVISDPSLATSETLAQVREQEERDSLSALGAGEATIHFLRYPDGGLAGVPRGELVGRIAEVLREAGPQVVVTFGPEGVTKHQDHVAIHQAATEAFHEAQAASKEDGAFQRLLYTALSQSDLDRFWQELRERGVELGDPEAPFMPRGVPDHTIAVRVDCRSVVSQKLAAIRAHRTQQMELEYLPEDLQPELLGQECFVQAWPPVADARGPIVSGVFDGLRG
jgi:N-acetyl-1-D-myo-inositol-2-amino-2-deoxy-alpha-D-glucopyranoside deacetylase